MGLNKVNTIGIRKANKCMQLLAIAYNLKKDLRFIDKHSKSGAASLRAGFSLFKAIIVHVLLHYNGLEFRQQYFHKKQTPLKGCIYILFLLNYGLVQIGYHLMQRILFLVLFNNLNKNIMFHCAKI